MFDYFHTTKYCTYDDLEPFSNEIVFDCEWGSGLKCAIWVNTMVFHCTLYMILLISHRKGEQYTVNVNDITPTISVPVNATHCGQQQPAVNGQQQEDQTCCWYRGLWTK